MREEFLGFSVRKLRQCAERIEDCLGRLTQEQIWWRGADTGNAVGNLVLHLCGNVTQWIVSGIGGAPDLRQRDAEFAAREGEATREELISRLRARLEPACRVIEELTDERLVERIQPQKYEVSVMEAVYHVVEHFSHHTGQIIYATKLLTGSDLGYYGHLRTVTHKETTP
jgi:uncharacterized damage-inducible protein DinB